MTLLGKAPGHTVKRSVGTVFTRTNSCDLYLCRDITMGATQCKVRIRVGVLVEKDEGEGGGEGESEG